ncbi:hypothetical protein [Reichenbachiella sp.]|uniref:hypothetical protein n=1 Tax=Reichenbachiella sp. TaxID=2184521 RepID=UPI003297BDE4
MRTLLICILSIVLFSCESYKELHVSKTEFDTPTSLYPIEFSLKYPSDYIDNTPLSQTGQRQMYAWINRTAEPYDSFSLHEMTRVKNGWPTNDFFTDSKETFLKNYPTARTIGRTIFKLDTLDIEFLHLAYKSSNYDEGHSWGVINLEDRQLQIQTIEYLTEINSTEDFLQTDAKVMLKSLHFEQ